MGSVYENLTSLLQHTGDLVFVIDTAGIIQAYNTWGIRMIGYTQEEVVGRPLTDLWINGKECNESLSWIQSEASVCVSNLETRFLKKNGEELDLSITLSKHKDSNGNVIGIVGVGRDITEKKKVEQNLKAIRREMENFIYIVSHDLKSPLISIEGYTSMLIRGYNAVLDDKGKHYVERIQWNINKMEALLVGLLEISRLGQVIGDLTVADVGQIISDILEDITPRVTEKGGVVVVSDNIPRIMCDRYRLAQVFENLLSNAVKFMGDQPEPKIEIGFRDAGRYYEFFVKDNGIGIAPVYHEKVFGIFQRLEDIPVEGTGVGLTIAKRIVENHGGRIWVESEPGQGATFYFTIEKRLGKNGKN